MAPMVQPAVTALMAQASRQLSELRPRLSCAAVVAGPVAVVAAESLAAELRAARCPMCLELILPDQ